MNMACDLYPDAPFQIPIKKPQISSHSALQKFRFIICSHYECLSNVGQWSTSMPQGNFPGMYKILCWMNILIKKLSQQ